MEPINLDSMSLGELQTLDTQLGTAITNRLSPGAANAQDIAPTSYAITGRAVGLSSLTELLALRALVKDAIARKGLDSDVMGISIVEFNDPDGGSSPSWWPQ